MSPLFLCNIHKNTCILYFYVLQYKRSKEKGVIHMKDNNVYLKMSNEATNRINAMEDKVAKEWYGCTWDELDYDDKELCTYEAYDRLNGGN